MALDPESKKAGNVLLSFPPFSGHKTDANSFFS